MNNFFTKIQAWLCKLLKCDCPTCGDHLLGAARPKPHPHPPIHPQPDPTPVPFSGGVLDVHFSPEGGCTDAAVKVLNAAKTQILVQAYSFTSQPIADALVEAKKRGVDVQVILDKKDHNGHGELGQHVKDGGVRVVLDGRHAIAHNKVMVVDGVTVITGSFNFTFAAEHHNAENLLVIHNCKMLADKYITNWQNHFAHSEAM